ncbi:MAG TPA: imidazole glycerol phosphate synthase subunit HisH [Ferruginibacter sp.]|nr:imidazole glycerol phosphate synthase subunit HisH [Ferruginibacter sp.]HPH93004.1 imidazole glycerol phosphate synthase subunit HisH [Ferruginibacter sp.]
MIAIVKYNAGNVQSVQYALQRLNVTSIVTDDLHEILTAEKVIFPGVGHAAPAMQYLKERKLDEVILSLKQPVLGICLGLQLMCTHSEEGDTHCLGIFNEQVKLFKPIAGEKVPQIGWNSIYGFQSHLFQGLQENDFVYSVHSYYGALGNETVATTNYIHPYSAALQNNNFYAVQFHPEKSGTVGETILKNFITLT